ncbi:hypothetical protein L218DRAFT_579759 [Marasmius fiardii PR-910]|nr:hypothetical protein L218DRAFT_579759 [Marasmius fiardii PR-910]
MDVISLLKLSEPKTKHGTNIILDFMAAGNYSHSCSSSIPPLSTRFRARARFPLGPKGLPLIGPLREIQNRGCSQGVRPPRRKDDFVRGTRKEDHGSWVARERNGNYSDRPEFHMLVGLMRSNMGNTPSGAFIIPGSYELLRLVATTPESLPPLFSWWTPVWRRGFLG